jgi:hypothetical protein
MMASVPVRRSKSPEPGGHAAGFTGITKAKLPSADLTTSHAGRPGACDDEARTSKKTAALSHMGIRSFTLAPRRDASAFKRIRHRARFVGKTYAITGWRR